MAFYKGTPPTEDSKAGEQCTSACFRLYTFCSDGPLPTMCFFEVCP